MIHDLAGRGARQRQAFDAQVAEHYSKLQREFVPLLMRRATLESVLVPESFAFEEPR